MRRDSFRFATVCALLCGLALASVARDAPAGPEEAPERGAAAKGESDSADASAEPRAIELRGRLVCLAEEMRTRFDVRVPPVHDHMLGLRVSGDLAPNELRYYSLLRTDFSKALFEDPRYRKEELVLSGRVFPRTALIDVTRFRWIREGELRDVYYWCEVCSIKTLDPGECACCQGEVEFREEKASGR